MQIARELDVSGESIYILENSGSSKVGEIVEGDNWYRKVCAYSDFRVAPYGVVSVDERFDDVVKRYKGRNHPLAAFNPRPVYASGMADFVAF